MLPGLDIAFRIEPLGLLFALVASSLWLIATLYAQSYMKSLGYPHLARFFACYAIALGAAAGIAFSDNLLTLFIFYEDPDHFDLSAGHPFRHRKCSQAAAASTSFYLLVSSIGLLLPAILWTYFGHRHPDVRRRRHPGRSHRPGLGAGAGRAVHVRHRQGRASCPCTAGCRRPWSRRPR
jgi:formate hydrogenlyase subunit 3/multisubunit Na+/H+ antiporter MnhD subunit